MFFWRVCEENQSFTVCINDDDEALYKDQENYLGLVLWSGNKSKPILGQKQAINFRTILDPTLLKN